jgi:hypothetical protein
VVLYVEQVRGSAKMHPVKVSCRLARLYRAKVCGFGCSFFQRRIWPLRIIKFELFVEGIFGLEAILQFVQVDGLLLGGSPEPFDGTAVETVDCYGDLDLGIGKGGDPSGTRELRSLIGIYDFGFAVFANALF